MLRIGAAVFGKSQRGRKIKGVKEEERGGEASMAWDS